jgi:hypothetical protein
MKPRGLKKRRLILLLQNYGVMKRPNGLNALNLSIFKRLAITRNIST